MAAACAGYCLNLPLLKTETKIENNRNETLVCCALITTRL